MLGTIQFLALIQSITLWFIIEIKFVRLCDTSSCLSYYTEPHPRSHPPIKHPSLQGQRSTGALVDGNSNYRLPRKKPVVWVLAELTQETFRPHDHARNPPRLAFGSNLLDYPTMVALQGCETHHGTKGKSISELYQTYCECLGEEQEERKMKGSG